MSVSVWDHKAQADAYHRTYPAVLRALANVVEGLPQVHTYEGRTRPSTSSSRTPPSQRRGLQCVGQHRTA